MKIFASENSGEFSNKIAFLLFVDVCRLFLLPFTSMLIKPEYLEFGPFPYKLSKMCHSNEWLGMVVASSHIKNKPMETENWLW